METTGYEDALSSLNWGECTVWSMMLNEHSFNHVEFDIHNKNDEPTPISDVQRKNWKNQKWSKLYAFYDKSCQPVRVLT